jgi:hypothetical protein
LWRPAIGLLLETYGFELGLGNAEFDERWISQAEEGANVQGT